MPRPATIAGRNFHHPHEGTCASPKITDEDTMRTIATTTRFLGESRFRVPPMRCRQAGTVYSDGLDFRSTAAHATRGTPMKIHRVTNSSYTDAFASAKYGYHSGTGRAGGAVGVNPASWSIHAYTTWKKRAARNTWPVEIHALRDSIRDLRSTRGRRNASTVAFVSRMTNTPYASM